MCEVIKRVWQSRSGKIGLILLSLFVLFSIPALVMSHFDFGANILCIGLIQSLWFALPRVFFPPVVVVFASAAIGGSLAAISAYFGTYGHHIIGRITDLVVSVPIFAGLMCFLIVTFSSPFHPWVLLTLVFVWAGVTLPLRHWAVQLGKAHFVQYTKAQGFLGKTIIFSDLFPFTFATLFGKGCFVAATMIIVQGVSTFLGTESSPPFAWEQVFRQAFDIAAIDPFYWWWVVSLVVMISIIAGTFGLLWFSFEGVVTEVTSRITSTS